jgi:hypothetical protein
VRRALEGPSKNENFDSGREIRCNVGERDDVRAR